MTEGKQLPMRPDVKGKYGPCGCDATAYEVADGMFVMEVQHEQDCPLRPPGDPNPWDINQIREELSKDET